MFERDATLIRQESLKSPVVMANAINFAILTANAPLMASVNAALWMRSKGDDYVKLRYEDISTEERSMMGNAMNRAKLAWTQDVIRRRDEIYKNYQSMSAIEFWHYLLDNVRGLAAVKAAFAVQMLYNELGCIDTHNLRMIGATAKDVSGKSKAKREKYLTLQATRTSADWWNSWVKFIAEKYHKRFPSADYVSRLHAVAVVGD